MSSTESPLPPPPLQRHMQLETDHFCAGCGYNLHGQVVTQDERLGFPVCRCPECGRFHPAAMGVSATRPWLARLGVMLIALWVLMVLVIMSLGGFFTGLCTYAHLETYTAHDYSNGYSNELHLRSPPSRATIGSDYYEEWETEWHQFAVIDGILSLGMGIFVGAITWHLKRDRRLLFLFFPVIVNLVLLWIWVSYNNVRFVLVPMLPAIAMYTFVSGAAMAIGMHIGRPIARFLVRLLIPSRLRQHVNFLWQCDGLTPPSLTD